MAGNIICSSYLFIYFIFWLCASLMCFTYLVGVDPRCNWYLHDINIFTL
jgi:hypothetical protein